MRPCLSVAYRLHSLGVLFHRVEQNSLRELPYYDTISRELIPQGNLDAVTLG